MFAVTLYLVSLLIAPQLWVKPFLGWPTDYIIIPFMAAAAWLRSKETDAMRLTPADWFMLGLLGWLVLSALANGFTWESRQEIIVYFRFMILFKLTSAILYDIEGARKFITVFVLLVSILAVAAIDQKYSADGIGWAGQTRAWIDQAALDVGVVGRSRWVGIFDGPGVFAVLFVICLPFALVRAVQGDGAGRRLLNAALVVLMVWATYATGSRGGFLGVLAIVGLYLLIRANVSLTAILASSIIATLAYMIAPDYLTQIEDSSKSTQYRVEMWAQGLNMLKDAPLFGIGPGNFLEYSGKLIAHNSAIEIMGETGLVGFFIWTMLILICVAGCARVYRDAEPGEDRNLSLAMMLAVLGYLVCAMFVTLEYETFYLLLAACVAVGRSAREPYVPRGRHYFAIGTAQLAFVAALQVFVIVYLG
jgi:O-antigen ligase